MDLKILFKALAQKAKQHKSIGKKFAKSYVSLFLVLILGVTSSFAWFAQRKAASIRSNNMEFQSASSLRINKDKSASNIIRIDKAVLDEASSIDGRNIYFPLDKSFTTNTDDMRFREGTKGDENVRYVYKDFELKGTSGNTPVYIKSYEIKVEEADDPHDSEVNATYHDQLKIGYDSQGRPNSQTLTPDHCPIRLAFISDSGDKPKVIDPSAQVVDYVDNSDAVAMIDENGVPTTKNTYNYGSSNSFSTYYYGNTPLFVIPGGDSLNVTLVVWLEGTIADCDKYIGKKISVDIDIESNFAEMETIKFVDGSKPDNTGGQEHWVSNDNPIIACSYEDPYSDETTKRWKTIIMTKSNSETYTWTCKIPKKVVSKISFYRLSRTNGSTQGTIYNAWHTTSDIATWITASNISDSSWYDSGSMDLQTTRQFTDSNGNRYNSLIYTAKHGNGYSVTNTTSERLAPCVGYWTTSGSSSGGGTSPTSASGSTEATSSSGGGSGGTTTSCLVNVAVETTNKPWIYTNVTNSHDQLWFWTQDGGNYQLTVPSGSTNRFTWSGTLAANDEIVGFYITNSSGTGYKDFSVTSTFVVPAQATYNANYYINNDDIMVLNS